MKRNNIKENDVLVFKLLLSSFLILFITLDRFSFNINQTSISYSYLLVPIILLIISIIINKFKIIDLISILLISFIGVFVFVTLIDFSLQIPISYNELLRPLTSIITSIIVFLLINKIIKYNSFIVLLINYLFGVIAYIIINQLFVGDLNTLIYIIPIELLISIIITIINKKKNIL